MRPRFEQALPCTPEAFTRELAAALARSDAACSGIAHDDYAILRMRTDERAFWSPALHLHVHDDGDAPTLRGTFSPSSPVWTLFIAIYLTLAIVGTCGLVYGLAQWTLEMPPWALLVTPAAAVLAGFVYGAAFIGQGLGADEMYELRSFVDHALERAAQD